MNDQILMYIFRAQCLQKAGLRKIAILLFLIAPVMLLSACSEEAGTQFATDRNGGLQGSFSPPLVLVESRAVDSTALRLSLTINDIEYMFDSVADGANQQTRTIPVNRGDRLRIVVTWSENYNGIVLPLAQASENYTVPIDPESDLIVRFLDDDYYTRFDNDNDGLSNLSERNANTDPTVAEASNDPIILVPLKVRATLPDRIRGVDSDINDSLFAVAEIDRIEINLQRDGDVWIGETTAATDSESLVVISFYSTLSDQARLARWTGNRSVGQGITVNIAADDYNYEFNSDGDRLSNLQEIIGRTNPLDSSDPPRDPCAVSNFGDGCTTDADGDGVPDSVETQNADTDGDGKANYLESTNVDADDDGTNAQDDPDESDPCIPSNTSVACRALTPTPPDVPDNPCATSNFAIGCTTDTDGDGVPDSVETQNADTDGDGQPNYLESTNTDIDADGTNAQNDLDDSDPCVPSSSTAQCIALNPTTPDVPPVVVLPVNPCATSNFASGCTTDTDGDGVPDSVETQNADTDGDGLPNYLESSNTDADGDGADAQNDRDDIDPCVPSATSAPCLALTPVVDPPVDTPPEPSLLLYEYYEGTFFVLPDFNSLTRIRTGSAATFSLPPNNGVLLYALRFTGKLFVDEAGDYTFYSESNDGTRLYIDDSLVVDNDGAHTLFEVTGTKTLSAGLHDIRLEYFQADGTEGLTVSWSSAAFPKKVISDAVLFAP